MDPGAVAGGSTPHAHRDCGSRDRVWLAREPRAEATAAPHPFCVGCGTVRDLTRPKAKPLGYFLSGVGHLAAYQERFNSEAKLVQVHRHLITSRLASRPEFEDPYGTPGPRQLETYVDVVRSIRPDLEEDLILRLLPGTKRRRSESDSTSAERRLAAHP